MFSLPTKHTYGVTVMYDLTAVREKEGMSENGVTEKEREKLIHFSWLLTAAESARPERGMKDNGE